MAPDTKYDFNPSTDIPSLQGKVILITGANTGLGKATAAELAKHSPAHIYMACRDPTKGAAALAEVSAIASSSSPNTKISLLPLDLASFDSIKSAASDFLSRETRLDVLLLNAGLMGCPPSLTAEGYEMQMGTNHIGHAALLKLLTPLLEKTASSSSTPRVVHLTSAGFRHVGPSGIELETLRSARSESTPSQPLRYCQSKLAVLLHARHAAKLSSSSSASGSKVKHIAINPGEVATELFSRETEDDHMKKLQTEVVPMMAIPLEEGVKNHLWACTAPDEEVVSGGFYEPVGREGSLEGTHALNEGMAQALWEWTQGELVKHGI